MTETDQNPPSSGGGASERVELMPGIHDVAGMFRQQRGARAPGEASNAGGSPTPDPQPGRLADSPAAVPNASPETEAPGQPAQPAQAVPAEPQQAVAPSPTEEDEARTSYESLSGSARARIEQLARQRNEALRKAAEAEARQAAADGQPTPAQPNINAVLSQYDFAEGFDEPEPDREEDPDKWNQWKSDRKNYERFNKIATGQQLRLLQAIAPHLQQQHLAREDMEWSNLSSRIDAMGTSRAELEPHVKEFRIANPKASLLEAVGAVVVRYADSGPPAPPPPRTTVPGAGRQAPPTAEPPPLTPEQEEKALFEKVRSGGLSGGGVAALMEIAHRRRRKE